MPPPHPLSEAFRRMSDEEAERGAATDPDAGIIPPGFWDNAQVVYGYGEYGYGEPKQQITLRLDAEVIRWFKRTGKGYHRAWARC